MYVVVGDGMSGWKEDKVHVPLSGWLYRYT